MIIFGKNIDVDVRMLKRIDWMKIVGSLGMLFLMWMTLKDVDTSWTDVDVTMGWTSVIMGALALPVMVLKRDKVKINWIDVLVFVWMIYYVCRVWLGGEYPCANQALRTMQMFMLYFGLRIFFGYYHIPSYVFALAMLFFGCYEAVWGVVQMITGTSRHHWYQLTGNFWNPGPYSAYLAIGGMVGLTIVQKNEKWFGGNVEKYMIIIMSIVCLIVVPPTWSRSAFVAIGVIALWLYRDLYWKYKYWVLGAIVLATIGLYVMKKGSADGRTMIWMASLTSWLHCPWLGTGVGGFMKACSEGYAEMYYGGMEVSKFNSADIAEYAFNDYLKILVEQGVAAALLCGVAGILVLIRVYRLSKPVFAGLLALVIFSMFSYPMELMPYKIILVLCVAWAAAESEGWAIMKFNRFLGMGIVVAGMACAYGLEHLAEKHAETTSDCARFSVSVQPAFIDDYYEWFTTEKDNSLFLFNFGQLLRNEHRYNDSNHVLRCGTEVSNDPMFYVLIGNNLKDMRLFGEAEKTYLKAYAIMPNRLYPLYQLMKMYEERGEKKKMTDMARRIAEFKPKVVSPATNQMQDEARKLLR